MHKGSSLPLILLVSSLTLFPSKADSRPFSSETTLPPTHNSTQPKKRATFISQRGGYSTTLNVSEDFTTLIQGEKRDRQINQLVGQNSKYGEWTYILTIEGSERGSDRFYLYHPLPFPNFSEITISWGKPHTMFEGGYERIATLEEQMAATLNFTPATLPVTIDHYPGIGTAFYANSKPNTLILVDYGPRRYQIHTSNTSSFLDPTGAFYYLIKDFKFLESPNPEN